MTHVHPDIVEGEPIPEIELRIDYARLEMIRILNRWWRWCLFLAFLYFIVTIVTHPTLTTRMMVIGSLLVLWVLVFARPSVRKSLAQQREVHRLNRGMHKQVVDIWGVPFRKNAEHFVMTGGLVVISPILVETDSSLGPMMIYPATYMLMAGIWVVVIGFHARQPGPISCEHCSYPLTGLTLPCMCPECGRSILDGRYTTDRPRVRSPWFFRIGVVSVALGGMNLYMCIVQPGLIYRVLPTRAVSMLAIGDDEAFEELIQTTMTPEKTDSMIESLIARGQVGRLGPSQQEWLGDRLQDGTLTDAQLDVILGSLPPIRINAPSSAKVGDVIEVSLSSMSVDLPGRVFTPQYFFRGFEVGDDPTLHSGSDEDRRWQYLCLDLARASEVITKRSDRPFYTLTLEESGGIEVRARVIIVVADAKDLSRFVWDEHGEGIFPAPPRWMRTIDLVHEIEVE